MKNALLLKRDTRFYLIASLMMFVILWTAQPGFAAPRSATPSAVKPGSASAAPSKGLCTDNFQCPGIENIEYHPNILISRDLETTVYVKLVDEMVIQ